MRYYGMMMLDKDKTIIQVRVNVGFSYPSKDLIRFEVPTSAVVAAIKTVATNLLTANTSEVHIHGPIPSSHNTAMWGIHVSSYTSSTLLLQLIRYDEHTGGVLVSTYKLQSDQCCRIEADRVNRGESIEDLLLWG